MAQENTAINQLIHLVTAPKLASDIEERESVEDLFWARNQVNARGGQATAIGTPVPMSANPHGLFSSDMDAALQSSGVYSSALRPNVAQAMTASTPSAANMNAELDLGQPPQLAAGSGASQMPFEASAASISGASISGAPRSGTPMSVAMGPASVAPMTTLPMRMLDGASPTIADTPGSRHAARVAAVRTAAPGNGTAARTAAARAAAAREMAANALAAQGGAPASTIRGVASPAARAIAQQAAVQAGVRPIFHDDEDDEQTIRVDHFQEQHARTAHGHPAYAQALPEPTVRVVPLTKMDDAKRTPWAFGVELLQTMRRFAVPLAILMVVAVFAGGYVAFNGQGGKPRRALVTPASASAPAPAAAAASPSGTTFEPINESQDKRSAEMHLNVSAMLATKLAEAHALESAALARGAVALEADEIEMDVMKVDADRSAKAARGGREAARGMSKREAARRERAAKREARARVDRDALDAALDGRKRDVKAEKREVKAEKREAKAEKREAKSAKREAKSDDAVGDGELPANVANKTGRGEGKLAVTSNIAAMIYVDGRATGMMTPRKFAVPAGPHKVTLLEPDSKKAKTQDVEIVAGKTASIDKQF